jgi:hypothetical protein
MPYVSTERNSQFWELLAGSWTSNLISADGFRSIAAGVELTQAGTIKIQLYVDQAGNVPQGTAVSTTLTANEANSVSTYDGAPFQSFTVTITNSSGSSAATVSDFVLLMNAA